MDHLVRWGPCIIAVTALVAAAPPATAGLPGVGDAVKVPVQLPLTDGAAGDLVPSETVGGVVDDVVNEPLPDPVEDVVENSPVAPVRDEVRRVADGVTGGGSGGGGGTGSGSIGSGTSSDGGTGGDQARRTEGPPRAAARAGA